MSEWPLKMLENFLTSNLLFDLPQPICLLNVQVGFGRLRAQLGTFAAEVIEATPIALPFIVCMSCAKSGSCGAKPSS
jgi:hypothetical protein